MRILLVRRNSGCCWMVFVKEAEQYKDAFSSRVHRSHYIPSTKLHGTRSSDTTSSTVSTEILIASSILQGHCVRPSPGSRLQTPILQISFRVSPIPRLPAISTHLCPKSPPIFNLASAVSPRTSGIPYQVTRTHLSLS